LKIFNRYTKDRTEEDSMTLQNMINSSITENSKTKKTETTANQRTFVYIKPSVVQNYHMTNDGIIITKTPIIIFSADSIQ
jgi:hypothetical protein